MREESAMEQVPQALSIAGFDVLAGVPVSVPAFSFAFTPKAAPRPLSCRLGESSFSQQIIV